MNGQLTLEEAVAEAARSITQADQNADQQWKDDAYRLLEEWLRRFPTWFCDDFWQVCERPREGRALGAVVLRASRNGLMTKSGQYRPSAGSHGTVKPVWRSEVYSA